MQGRHRMGTALLAVLLPTVASGLPNVPDREWLETAPRQPLHKMPFTLGVAALSAGDCDPDSRPSVAVDGNTLRVDLSDNPSIQCDALEPHAFVVEVPGLAAGEYTVEVFNAGVPQPSRTFSLQVQFAAVPSDASPNPGFWTDQQRPGTGVYLQPRGDLLGVGLFDFNPQQDPSRDQQWSVVAAPLHGREALLLMPRITQGSCLGCSPHKAPSEVNAHGPVHLHFESARRARATLADGAVVPLVSLPFGADYVDLTLSDSVDAEFGPLPLPDLEGRWFIDEGPGDVVEIRPATVTDAGTVQFYVEDGNSYQIIECASANDGARAGCSITHHCCSPPARYGFALLGDITEDRIHFARTNGFGETIGHFEAVRLPPSAADGSESRQ